MLCSVFASDKPLHSWMWSNWSCLRQHTPTNTAPPRCCFQSEQPVSDKWQQTPTQEPFTLFSTHGTRCFSNLKSVYGSGFFGISIHTVEKWWPKALTPKTKSAFTSPTACCVWMMTFQIYFGIGWLFTLTAWCWPCGLWCGSPPLQYFCLLYCFSFSQSIRGILSKQSEVVN